MRRCEKVCEGVRRCAKVRELERRVVPAPHEPRRVLSAPPPSEVAEQLAKWLRACALITSTRWETCNMYMDMYTY